MAPLQSPATFLISVAQGADSAAQERNLIRIPGRNLPTVWIYGSILISVSLIIASGVQVLGGFPEPLSFLLNKLSLGFENNVGAWWSGMLLALASFHAFDGYARLRATAPCTARAWAIISAILLAGSADEVCSFHERQGALTNSLGFGIWLVRIPIGIAGILVLWYAFRQLWLDPQNVPRRTFWLLVLGFGLLATIPLQEFLERRLELTTPMARALRVSIEEGAELFAVMILLRASMTNTAGFSTGIARRSALAFSAFSRIWRHFLMISLVLVPVFAFATAQLTDTHRGLPANWPGAIAFLAAGLALLTPYFRGEGSLTLSTLVLSGLCWTASVLVCLIRPINLIELGPVEASVRLLVVGSIGVCVAVGCFLRSGDGRKVDLPACATLLLLVMATLSPNLTYVFLLSQLMGLAVFWVCMRAISRDGVIGHDAVPASSQA